LAIDLAEDRRLVRRGACGAINANRRAERELRARKHADRRGRIGGCGKAARASAEIGGPKNVTDACGTRFDMHQAVVTHIFCSFVEPSDRANAWARSEFICA